MKLRRLFLALGFAAFGAAAAAQTRPSREYTIEQFLSTTGISGASFSFDGTRLLFSSNATGIYNVQSIPTSGGSPTPLTRSPKDTTFAVSYFPADDRLSLHRATREATSSTISTSGRRPARRRT